LVTAKTGKDVSLVTATIPEAGVLSTDAFERTVRDIYLRLADAIAALGQHPVRFWNFIPDLNAPVADGLDRYMAFNVGRYDACVEWMGSAEGFDQRLATASAVGIAAPDLRVHCLTSVTPGAPVENPRQVPAYRYSSRFGPRPPCFARATRVSLGGRLRLLIGGTASIIGEESVHVGEPTAQAMEALANVEALIARETGSTTPPLAHLASVRLYLRNEAYGGPVRETVERRCGSHTRIECVIAQICRPELLLEMEGVADLRSDVTDLG
jgi:chorismate lyase/3-hydroxybenzoate synthase